MPRSSRDQPSILRRLGRFGVAVLGADLGLRLASRTRVEIGPVVAETRVVPDLRGGTGVHIPPVGDAELSTHQGPLRLEATVTGVDEKQVRELVQAGQKPSIDVQRELKKAGESLGKRAVAAAAAGAAAATAISERSLPQALAGALRGSAALAAGAGIAYKTAHLDAWKNPHLTGLLARAPQIVGDVRQIPNRFEKYRTQINEITASVTGLLHGLTSLPDAPPEDAIRIVWLSDVHNNPTAFSIARSLVQQYGASMVIDTGDIGDWGMKQESRTYSEIKTISVPYLFIKGNHDGPQTLDELRKISNVVIVDNGEPVEIAGVRIVGAADPRFTPDKSTGDDNFPSEKLVELGRAFAAKVSSTKADIALLHDPVEADQLNGAVPLGLCGHTHRRNDRMSGSTLVLTQGSSGGAGLRGVRQDPPDPLTVSVLHLDPATKTLITLDELTYGGLGRTEVTVVRRPRAQLGLARADREQ